MKYNLSPREKNYLEKIYPYLSECTLFLARDNSFPLSSSCKIAAYGRGVRATIKGGTGSGDVNSRFFITIEEGLEDAGFKVVTKDWLDKVCNELYVEARKNWVEEIKRKAKENNEFAPVYAVGKTMCEPEYPHMLNHEADAAIYVVSRNSGEGADRDIAEGDILLTQSEIRDILELNKKYKKFMLVINAGGVVDLSPVLEVRNILILSELGTEIGRAFADILLGKSNPSGKLTASWAKIEDYPYEKEIPLHDTYYKEGRYVGYRYFDSFNVKPLFPFGYGLSYTDFKLDNFKVTNNGKIVVVNAQVTNIGHYKGKEVLQAYISYLGKEESPYQELVGFCKTNEIEPNKKEEISCSFDLSNIAKYDLEKEIYYLPQGDYLLRVGNASNNTTPIALIHLEEEIIIKEAKNIYSHISLDEIKPSFIKEKPSKIHKITLNQMDFNVISLKEEEIIVPDEIKKLKTKDLIKMSCGYVSKGMMASFIGNSSVIAPGAAGEASYTFRKHFHNNIVMADGPAGLRLIPQYYRKGNKIITNDHNSFIVDAVEFMPKLLKTFFRKFILRKKKTAKNHKFSYQYCTAVPIATAIAQSFNVDLAYLLGDVVGNEMEEFNVDLWLAPGMNIQRTIMCGRNFEYYSEDPYLSGMMASSICKGVQSHPGKGAVIKHFACNNQETFRFVSNSIVSEPTLREIYLRGFEICIRDANPKGIMSSYNLLNGSHTSECVELIHDFLFMENGYKGIVMTDWTLKNSRPKTAHYDISRIEKVYKTSTSLFMPGSKFDLKRLKKDIKAHPENRHILEINATRLFKNFAK